MRDEATAPVELTESAPGNLTARGPLTFATARSARAKGLAVLSATGAKEIQVDCSGITASDSAGMSVLLDWLAFAKRNGRSLHYGNLPEQVQAIAHISDVLELLEKGV
ncbi:MAG: STAS domain-containing protein [Proteobacteria bacterium]|nr:STAS domain-containing protein [Pseudomonadota bacterium]